MNTDASITLGKFVDVEFSESALQVLRQTDREATELKMLEERLHLALVMRQKRNKARIHDNDDINDTSHSTLP
jgi:hypothetical protein